MIVDTPKFLTKSPDFKDPYNLDQPWLRPRSEARIVYDFVLIIADMFPISFNYDVSSFPPLFLLKEKAAKSIGYKCYVRILL